MVVTYEHIISTAQTVIYDILKDNISVNTINRIKGRASIEVHKKKDFPIIEVDYPTIEKMDRHRLDYTQKKIKLNFKINIHSIKDGESITLTELVLYTLESHQADIHTGLMYKYNVDSVRNKHKWDTKIEKKYYTSIVEFSVIWSGA